MISKKTGAIYIRVSTDKQEELSPDAQLRLLMDYAQKNSIDVPKEYVFQDNGISGRKADKRPAFQKMIAIAKSKDRPIDTIIVWKYSRFARNQEESIVYKSLLKKNNVDVVSVSEPLVDGPFGTLIERIIEWMDEYYSIRLSGEVMRGMTQNAMRGHYQGEAPIGYRSPGGGKPPEKDQKTLPIPLKMKDMLFSGYNFTQIARSLNDMGYRTKRGNLWDSRGVRYVLENPFYAGVSRWNYTDRGRKLKPSKEVIYSDGNWEPLWDKDTYNDIVRIITESTRKPKSRNASNVKHWLSGILTCSSCGATLGYSGTDRSGHGFQCWKYSKGMCSESHYIGVRAIEDLVIRSLETLLNADMLTYSVVCSNSLDKNNRIFEIRQQLQKLDAKEKRIKAAYLNEIDTLEEYRTNKELLKHDRDSLLSQLKELSSEQITQSKEELDAKMKENISNLIDVITDPTSGSETKGNAIRTVVDHIVFHRKENHIDVFLKLTV